MYFLLSVGKTLQDGAQEVGSLGMKEGSRLILMGRKVASIYFISLYNVTVSPFTSITLNKRHRLSSLMTFQRRWMV